MAKHHHHRLPKLARPHKQLRLRASQPNIDIEVDMGDGPATPTAGYAGWEEVPRPEKRAMTGFKGLPSKQQDIPILIDGFREDRSVDRQVEEVLSLGAKVIFLAEGPIYDSGRRFVFGDEPEFTEQIRDTDESLLRVRMVLKLMRYGPADVAGRPPRSRIGLGNAVPLSFTVHGSINTLSKIASEVYGDHSRWKEIGAKNGITDPHHKLKQGRELIL